MILQDLVGLSFLLTALVITAAFLIIAKGSKRGTKIEEFMPQTWVRTVYIIFILVIVSSLGFMTIPLIPYPSVAQQIPAQKQVVTVIGQQFFWTINASKVKVGPVEFDVTSKDVNHGFAIFDPDGILIAQTQAMPGYVNQLIIVLEKPGTYKVLCLEYCGVQHSAMIAYFEAVAS